MERKKIFLLYHIQNIFTKTFSSNIIYPHLYFIIKLQNFSKVYIKTIPIYEKSDSIFVRSKLSRTTNTSYTYTPTHIIVVKLSQSLRRKFAIRNISSSSRGPLPFENNTTTTRRFKQCLRNDTSQQR